MESKLEKFWKQLSHFKIQKIERITIEENSINITCVEIGWVKNSLED